MCMVHSSVSCLYDVLDLVVAFLPPAKTLHENAHPLLSKGRVARHDRRTSLMKLSHKSRVNPLPPRRLPPGRLHPPRCRRGPPPRPPSALDLYV